MRDKLLTSFNNDNIRTEYNSDLREKIGSIGLGLLRMGLGKTVKVEKISGNGILILFAENSYPYGVRMAAIATFIFAFPVTVLLISIGAISMASSKSHEKIFNLYSQVKSVLQERKQPPNG